jgi:hypothetical protein
MAPSVNFGTVNTNALIEYFVQKFNLVGRDAEYSKNRPTLAAIPRDTQSLLQAETLNRTLKVGGGFSGSPDWVLGNTYHNPSKKVKWKIDYPYSQYGFLTFDCLALRRNNLATLLDIKGGEADDVREGMLNTCEFELWNDGTGSRGKVSAISGTTTITVTLTNVNDVYNFEFGQMIYGSTTSTGAGTDHTNRYKITDLQPLQGKIVADRVVDNSSVMAANDFIFVLGSKDAYMPGIPTFIPASDPSDTLYNVARTGNPALSGWRFPFKASISETIQRSFSTMGRWVNRAAAKFCVVLSTTDWLLLSMERESKVVPDPTAVQKWGLEGLIVRSSYGPITCIAIPQVPDGRGYILDFSTWKLFTAGNLPHVMDEDGLTMVRGGVSTPDGNVNGDFLKMQLRMWKVLLCERPMSNATFPTA